MLALAKLTLAKLASNLSGRVDLGVAEIDPP